MAHKRNGDGPKRPAGAKTKGGKYRAAASGRYVTATTAKATSAATVKKYRVAHGKSPKHGVETVVHTRSAPAPTPRAVPYAGEALSDVVRARIHPSIKREAAAVLEAMGLSVSDAFRLMMIRVVAEKTLPFSPLVPNEETIEAMRAARRGELVAVANVDELFQNLNADD